MKHQDSKRTLFFWLGCLALALHPVHAATPAQATLRIRAQERAILPISPYITGKFAEHLGNNIYNGMDAQILRNPTFADFPFATGQMSPDGIATFHFERDKIDQEIRRRAGRSDWPESELNGLIESFHDGLACWWTRVGPRDAVQVSPDASLFGQRAQRLEVKSSGQGLAQWAFLPLHRTRSYEFEVYLRSPQISRFTVTLDAQSTDGANLNPANSITLDGVSSDWRRFTGKLEVPATLPPDTAYRFSLTANEPGQFVIGRLLLRPADHIQGADPDVVRFLRDSHLSILRWPGGNFVSGYHWEDGIGPVEKRPTKPNYAWGGVEPNLFGTDEFVAFCRAVGCEPMICVNAGSGSPQEAARWIEYCNGSIKTPLGRLRAANGHRQPYNIRYWEVGNELWGRWQYDWTTAAGNVDRYRQFAKAMRSADKPIILLACGAPVFWGKSWNDTLVTGLASDLEGITDHPLIGGTVSANADPLDVFRDFMAVPDVLAQKWIALEKDMSKAGVRKPRLAVTELQMFAHLGGATDTNAPVKLRPNNLVNPGTQGEALYDILIYHAAIRLAPFVDMITHSAIVNHGGGLRKERERVYANPCHYAQATFAQLAGAVPVHCDLEAPEEPAPLVLPELRNVVKEHSFKTVDALAALTPQGELLISLVHRAGQGETSLTIRLDSFMPGKTATLRTLSAEQPWIANTLRNPEAVKPSESTVSLAGQEFNLLLKPYSYSLVRISPAKN